MNGMEVRQEIERAIENRTINHPKPDKMDEYECGCYNPKFAFVIRDSRLKCVWVGNLKKETKDHPAEPPIITYGNTRFKTGFTPKGWSQLAEWIIPHMEKLTKEML